MHRIDYELDMEPNVTCTCKGCSFKAICDRRAVVTLALTIVCPLIWIFILCGVIYMIVIYRLMYPITDLKTHLINRKKVWDYLGYTIIGIVIHGILICFLVFGILYRI